MSTHPLPGKLGTPGMTLETDPRLDPRLAQVLAMMPGLAGNADAPGASGSLEDALEYCHSVEEAGRAANALALEAMPEFPAVDTSIETIKELMATPSASTYINPAISNRQCLASSTSMGAAW